MYRPAENIAYRLDYPTPEQSGSFSLWERILELIEQDLAERRGGKLFVELRGGSGLHQKEIGELSASERQSLPPVLREHIAERLLDRYLAEQGYVDLVEKRRTYTKKVQDLTPKDLPALVEADRWKAEEEHEKERGQAEFIQETRADLERLLIIELAGTTKIGRKV